MLVNSTLIYILSDMILMRCSIMKVTLVIADVLLACGGGAAFTGTGGSGTQGFAGGTIVLIFDMFFIHGLFYFDMLVDKFSIFCLWTLCRKRSKRRHWRIMFKQWRGWRCCIYCVYPFSLFSFSKICPKCHTYICTSPLRSNRG